MNYKKQYLKYKQKYLMSQMGGSGNTSQPTPTLLATGPTLLATDPTLLRAQLLLLVNTPDYNTTIFDISAFNNLQEIYGKVSSVLAAYIKVSSNKYNGILNILLTEVFKKLSPLKFSSDTRALKMYPAQEVPKDKRDMLSTINIEKLNESFAINPDLGPPPQFKIYNKPSVLTINQHLLNYVGEIYRNTLFNIRELLNSENVQASENRVVVDEPEEVNLETVKNLIQQNFEFFKKYSGIDSRLIDIKKNSFITALCSDEGVSKGEYSHIFVALIKAPQ
jgi:hypothetical protein